jgi:hypothetical protein
LMAAGRYEEAAQRLRRLAPSGTPRTARRCGPRTRRATSAAPIPKRRRPSSGLAALDAKSCEPLLLLARTYPPHGALRGRPPAGGRLPPPRGPGTPGPTS